MIFIIQRSSNFDLEQGMYCSSVNVVVVQYKVEHRLDIDGSAKNRTKPKISILLRRIKTSNRRRLCQEDSWFFPYLHVNIFVDVLHESDNWSSAESDEESGPRLLFDMAQQ